LTISASLSVMLFAAVAAMVASALWAAAQQAESNEKLEGALYLEQPTRLSSSRCKSGRVTCSIGHVAMPQLGAGNQPSSAWCKRPGHPRCTRVGATRGSSERGSLKISE
jgi:hypothetical protein